MPNSHSQVKLFLKLKILGSNYYKNNLASQINSAPTVNIQETNNLVYGELQRQGGKGGGPPPKTDAGGQGTQQPQ